MRELADQNEKLSKQLAAMHSPRFLEMRIKELNLGLARPEQSQVWQLPEPSRDRSAQSAEQQYAAHAGRAPTMP